MKEQCLYKSNIGHQSPILLRLQSYESELSFLNITLPATLNISRGKQKNAAAQSYPSRLPRTTGLQGHQPEQSNIWNRFMTPISGKLLVQMTQISTQRGSSPLRQIPKRENERASTSKRLRQNHLAISSCPKRNPLCLSMKDQVANHCMQNPVYHPREVV